MHGTRCDVIRPILDDPSVRAAFLGFLDQFPRRLHAAVGAIPRPHDASESIPLRSNSSPRTRHIRQIRNFMQLLPAILRT